MIDRHYILQNFSYGNDIFTIRFNPQALRFLEQIDGPRLELLDLVYSAAIRCRR